MEQNNTTETPKLIFGLSPNAAIINSFIIAALAQLFWAICAASQLVLNGTEQQTINVPWYYELPLSVLSLIMLMSWVNHRYNLNMKEFNIKHTGIRIMFLVCSMVFQLIMKIIFLILFYPTA